MPARTMIHIQTAEFERVMAATDAMLDRADRLIEVIPPIRRLLRDGDPNDQAQQVDLACELAVHLLGWKPAFIPKDARGENECMVLTETGTLPLYWQPAPVGSYPKHTFIPRVFGSNQIKWFAGIEEALAFAREVLGLRSLRWSRDIGGTFTLIDGDLFSRRSGRSSSHCPSDAYAIIDAALGWLYHEADSLIVGRRA